MLAILSGSGSETTLMPRKKSRTRPVASLSASAFEQAWSDPRAPQAAASTPPPTVSGRWLLAMIAAALLAAAVCAWAALCILFWQGNWQLLYHPTSAVTRTPATLGLSFDAIGFAADEAGQPRLKGWWIPAASDARYASYTVLYLHGQDGNIGDTLDALAALHSAGVNVLAFDYRGYGQSQFAPPSETRWREDADSAIRYVTGTRHVPADSIVLDGGALGANLALETAAAHPELAGVVLRNPLDDPTSAIFSDPRARMVPAHALVRDRFDQFAPAAALHIPSLWLIESSPKTHAANSEKPDDYRKVAAQKMRVWLPAGPQSNPAFTVAMSRWLDDLHR